MEKKTKKDTIDFIGIGGARCGSTWVSECLKEHPQILFSSQKSRKELYFFNGTGKNVFQKKGVSFYDKGIDWYLNMFPKYQKGKIRGEFGITYLTDPLAPKRIKKHFPDVKIIAILRNPVDMVYSLHWYCVNAVEPLVPVDFNESIKKGFYLKEGEYYRHLNNYYSLFKKENIHIILLDDVKNNPKKVVENLYSFLGVDETFEPSVLYKKINESLVVKNTFIKKLGQFFLNSLNSFKYTSSLRDWILKNSLIHTIYLKVNVTQGSYNKLDDESLKKYLKSYFKPDLLKLEKLINRDLSAWYE